MRIRIQGGTVKASQPSLCLSCANAEIVQGNNGEEIRKCFIVGSRYLLPSKVTACTSYDNKSLPSLSEMKKIAWVLRTEKNGRSIGFQAPKMRYDEIGDEIDE